MNKSGIEWTEFTLNPVRGKCPHECWYCYADAIRQLQGYKSPEFIPSVLDELSKRKKPSVIFIGSMIDLWADAIPDEWRWKIIEDVRLWRQHKYLFLTKNPARYNTQRHQSHAWYGVTVDQDKYFFDEQVSRLEFCFGGRIFSFNSFVSLEPLCGPVNARDLEYTIGSGLKQFIIGAMTGQGKSNVVPEKKWVMDIIEVADAYKVKVFLKDNLLKIYPDLPRRRELEWM